MSKKLAALFAIAAAVPAAAHALDINCEAPMVAFGDARPGSGSSVGVRISIDQGRFGWQVFHDLRDGRVISRIDQYAVIDMRNAVNYQKPGVSPRRVLARAFAEQSRPHDGGAAL
jgi:hypothetical protein